MADQPPIEDPRILEAMEACRPGSGDLSDPRLAFLARHLAASPDSLETFGRLQRLDASLARAIQDVAVPEGLADRIAARLAPDWSRPDRATAADPGGGPAALGATAGLPGSAETTVGQANRAAPRRRMSRRWLLGGVGSAAVVAASVAVALLLFGPEPPRRSPPEVIKMATDFFEKDGDQVGRLVAETSPPEAYPTGPDFGVSRFPNIRWRWVEGFLGQRAVAYDLTRPGAPRATLYVARYSVPGLSTFPPPKPMSTTRNRSSAAWQTGGLLYVLVVEGGERTYEGFLPRMTWT